MADAPVVGTDDHRYSWLDGWGRLPDHDHVHHGWAHHGLVLTRAGEVIGFHPNGGALLAFDLEGNLLREIPCDIVEGHGLTLVEEDGDELLWIADPRVKGRRDDDGRYVTDLPFGPQGRVVKVSLVDGSIVQELRSPEQEVYLPTWVAVDEERFGGSGDVWVADGYGTSQLYRYDRDGELLATIDGTESGAGRLNCPHAILIDRRRDEAELYVADRTNARVVVFGLDGSFRRTFGEGWLTSPSALATHGEHLVIAELRARVVVLDGDDRLVVALGENEEACDRPGWPNSLGGDGSDPALLVRNLHLEPGKFNSPHGIAVDGGGNVYVAEWLIGGRMTKLEPGQ